MTQDALREGIQRGLPRLQGAPGVVLGSSFGGFTAIRYALARPDLVTGLILVSPFGAPMTPGELDRCVRLLRAQSLADAKEFLDDVAVRPWSGHWLLAPGVRRMLHRRPLLELLEHVHQTPWLTAEELARVQVPVTVVWGRHETLFPESHVDFWRQLPGVRLVRPPRSAHAPSVDEPARFERIVLEHLEAVRTRPGPPHAPQIAERLANR